MPNNQVEKLKCSRCNEYVVYVNFWSDYAGIVKTLDFRCLICFELEKTDTKQRIQSNRLGVISPLPESMKKIKEIKERKIQIIDELIKELQQEKETIKEKKY